MKRLRISLFVSIITVSNVIAQTLEEAIKQTTNEQYESAETIFKSIIQKEPNNGDAYFYYGENYFKNENMPEAKKMYEKGIEVNATNPLPYVGLGKIKWYKGQEEEAKADFYKATTLGNKNAVVLMKIADVYINAETKNLPEALTLLAKAEKLDSKNPEVFILTGDAYLEQNNGTKAIEYYEKATTLNPKSVKATLRQGQLYNRAKNYSLALDFYKSASLIDSSFAPAYREKAEIYFRAGQYNNAVAQYKKYLELNNNCSARLRYAGFLYKAKQYALSVDAVKEAKKCAPDNQYLDRYLTYDYYELGDDSSGLASSKLFFQKANPEIIIAEDYEYRGRLYSKLGEDSLAIIDYTQAMKMDPTKNDLANDIATSYMKLKKFTEAIDLFEDKLLTGSATINDYYALGRAYYYSKNFISADSAFAKMVELQPNLALGYLWRAKANVQTDPNNEKWKAKEWYEEFIAKVKPEELERSKKDLIGAFNYLAAHYASKKDCSHTKEYLLKVVEIDQNNTEAKKVLTRLKC